LDHPDHPCIRRPQTRRGSLTLRIVVVGVIYAVITGRVIYSRIFGASSIHMLRVTKKGTATWVGIIVGLWITAFIIGEAIPAFSLLLALMSSLFDSWFGRLRRRHAVAFADARRPGFIFWGVAFFVRPAERLRRSIVQLTHSASTARMHGAAAGSARSRPSSPLP
jgi:hypothetical protein